MRILHVLPCYLPGTSYGGPIASVHGLSRGLVGRGHSPEVWTTDLDGWRPLRPAPPARDELDGVTVRYFAAGSGRRIHRAPAMADALAREAAGFDLVHLHGLWSWPTLAAARAAEAAGVPFAVSPRGMLVRELLRARGALRKRAWLAAFERRTLERAAFVHATADSEERDLRAFDLAWPRIETIPNGVEPVSFDGDWSRVSPAVRAALERDDALLFLGRLSWKKGLARLVHALAIHPRGHLVVAGPDHGFERPLRRLVRELGLDARVTLVGPVSGADRAALLARARAFVLPSLHENFGNAVLEAMSAGLPVVVSRKVGAAELVRGSGAGVVVAGDPPSVARALDDVLAPALGRAMGEAGRRTARERFSWASVAALFEDAYARAADGARTSALVAVA